MIKLSSPWITELEKEYVCRVLDSHAINMGGETRKFEEELKAFFGGDHDVTCVNSATAALHLSLQAIGVGRGDEVLVPTYTFIASFQAISATGATPIPVDVDLDDAFVNLKDLQKRITKNTKAIMPVLYAGCGTNKISDIYKFAQNNGLRVVEDAAHCFGDQNITKREFDVMCFSFDAIKNITCSDGGCVVTSDKNVTNNIKDSRLLGVIGDTEARYSGKRSWNSDTLDQGWRYHMSNICAGLGRAQLSRFQEIKYRRQKYSNMYISELSKISGLNLFPINAKTAVPHIFPVIVKDGRRDELKEYLYNNGIESGIQYKPNHFLTKFNKGYNLPNAEWIYANVLSIPLHANLSDGDIIYVVEKINELLGCS